MSAVSVVVVSHNSERWLGRCLEGAAGQGQEIVVVDNASSDGGVALVRSRFPDVRLVQLDQNLGYGVANNIGVEGTQSPYVLLLNPDAWPVDDALERLVAAAESLPTAAIIGPRLVRPDGGQEASVRGFPTVWRIMTVFLFIRWLAPWSRTFNAFYGAGVGRSQAEVDWVIGAVMLVRRDAFDQVGGFDPSFFMYAEEIDLAYRLSQHGWKTVYHPAAEFVHVGGGSSESPRAELLRELLRSLIRYLDKHHGAATARRARRWLLASMRLRSLVLTGERRRAAAQAARWLADHDLASILAPREPRSADPTAESPPPPRSTERPRS